MEEVRIEDAAERHLDDVCRFCIPPPKQSDPAFVQGMEDKKAWALEMLRRWGGFAKLAYLGDSPVGLIQYEPEPARRVVRIHCIYVPRPENSRLGIATRLLECLIEDLRASGILRGIEPLLAVVTRTFPGEGPDQYPARLFFLRKGFRQIGDDADLLCCPLGEDLPCASYQEPPARYIPQAEDEGKALLISGPSFCPFSYPFLKMAEQAILEIAPGIPVRWISRGREPDEAARRGIPEGCVVNARLIKAFVLDRERFREEVAAALMAP